MRVYCRYLNDQTETDMQIGARQPSTTITTIVRADRECVVCYDRIDEKPPAVVLFDCLESDSFVVPQHHGFVSNGSKHGVTRITR